MMRQKDYESIAEILAENYPYAPATVERIRSQLSRSFMRSNPRFNPEKFYSAVMESRN